MKQTNQDDSESRPGAGSAAAWIKKLDKARKAQENWAERVRKINKLYKQQDNPQSKNRQYAMLWANTEVLKESVYSQTPVPVVMRRFKDKDPVGRQVAEVLERSLATQQELGGDDDTYQLVRDDFLLGARGTGRVRYEFEEVNGQVTNERAVFECTHWSDFLHGPARKWKAVPWTAFRAFLLPSQWKKRWPKFPFPAPQGRNDSNLNIDDDSKVNEGKAAVWEIWDKTTRKVYFVNESTEDILEEIDPPLNFKNFWPCPKPAYGTTTSDSLIPTPDYVYYQDQAEEIDELTTRIGKLTDALKMVGFYPKGEEESQEIEKALSPGVENMMIGIDNWAAFAEKGGVSAVVFLPVKDVVAVLRECVELRRQLIEDVYQITGISDIVRGDTDANETLGAQQLKSQWGSIRIRSRQKEMARFARDITELQAEIIAEHFQPQTLAEMTGQEVPPEVVQLLRNDRLRSYRIDIETDSTVVADEQAEKQVRNEFLGVMSTFVREAVPVIQQAPQMAPVLGEVLLFTVRGYRAGRQLEETIEQAVEQLSQMAQQPQQTGPTKIDEIMAKGEVDRQLQQDRIMGEGIVKEQLQEGQQEHDTKMLGLEIMAESQRPQGPAVNG